MTLFEGKLPQKRQSKREREKPRARERERERERAREKEGREIRNERRRKVSRQASEFEAKCRVTAGNRDPQVEFLSSDLPVL